MRKTLFVFCVFLVAFAFVLLVSLPTLSAQQRNKNARGEGNVTGAGRWTVMTYIGEDGPFAVKSDPLPGGGVSFNFLNTPDRAMLITDSPSYKRLLLGNLTGKLLYVRVEIEATPGATFNYYGDGETRPANVRLYFQKANTPGCPSGWHPERPDCEAQYWWSNPASIDLRDLAAYGRAGYIFQVPLQPEYWSDRDGHMGTAITPIDHLAAFRQAVANIEKIGVSFGGGNNFAFGYGVDPGFTATFKLLEYIAK